MPKFVTALFVLLLACGPVLAQTPPDEIARERWTTVVGLIKANREAYAKDHRKLYAMVEQQALPYFDFRVMAKAVLARHWRSATELQRDRFISEFRNLLIRTYSTALLKYNDQQIRYLPFNLKPGDTTATVRAEVLQREGGPPVQVSYTFYDSNGSWKLFDVSIEGVSLVTNYRTVYSQRIQNQGLDALIDSIAGANRRDEPEQAPVGARAQSGP